MLCTYVVGAILCRNIDCMKIVVGAILLFHGNFLKKFYTWGLGIIVGGFTVVPLSVLWTWTIGTA